MQQRDLLNTEDFNDLFDKAKKEIHEITSIKDLLLPAIKMIDSPEKSIGILSGIDSIDKINNGWKDGDVTFIGGAVEMDSIGFASTLLLHPVFNDNKTIGYFSSNANSQNFIGNLCSTYAGMFNSTFKSAIQELSTAPIHLDCRTHISIDDLKHQIYVQKRTFDVDMIIIDNIDYVSCGNSLLSKEQCEGKIIKSLKEIAYYFKIPIIVLKSIDDMGSMDRYEVEDAIFHFELEIYSDTIIFLTQNDSSQSRWFELRFIKHKNNRVSTEEIRYVKEFSYFVGSDPDYYKKPIVCDYEGYVLDESPVPF